MYISFNVDSVLKDIAKQLDIHYRSVEIHIKNIRKILNISKTIEIFEVIFPDGGNAHNIVLTPKGAGVFHLLRRGETVKEIAKILGVSVSAINRHRENMLFFNECNTILELVSKYYGQYKAPKNLEKTNARSK